MKIFISYARVNRKQVETLEKLLTDLRHDAWFDREIVAGEDWWKSITSSIERCEVFVFALSPQSTNSSACRAEFQYALDLNKPILPVMLLDAELPVGKLRETQFVNGRALNRPETIIELSKALSVLKDRVAAGEFPPPDPLPSRPAFPFPPDPLAEIRQKLEHIDTLTEQDMLEIVYQLSATARVGAKTEREALTILREIARYPRSTLRVVQVAKEAIQLRSGRRTVAVFIGVSILVIIMVAFTAVVLTNRARNDIERTRNAGETQSAVRAAETQVALNNQIMTLSQATGTLDSRLQTLESAQTAVSASATPDVTATLVVGSTATASPDFSVSPTLQSTPISDTGCTIRLTRGGVNIRQYPGNTFAIIGTWNITREPLPILAYAYTPYGSIYYQVLFEGQIGWISTGLDNTQLTGTCRLDQDLPLNEVVFPE